MKSQHYILLAGALAPALLLLGCAGSGPSEQDFLSNANKLRMARDTTICLPVQDMADYTSNTGPFPSGWSVVLDKAKSGNASRLSAKLSVLVSAGLATKEPYSIYKNGELVPGLRYSLTPEGRKALSGGEFGACIQIGHWEAKRLVPPPADAKGTVAYKGLIHNAKNGDTPLYEAYVAFEAAGTPAWANAKFLAAFPELQKMQASSTQKVELVQYNKSWVTPAEQANQRNLESAKAGNKKVRAATEIPEGMQAKVLAKMTDSAKGDFGFSANGIRLVAQENSETPRALASAKPGSMFFAVAPDPSFREREAREARQRELAEREKNAELLPPETRARVKAEVQKARDYEVVHAKLMEKYANTANADTYLNRRKELKELFDALVDAGAYEKQVLKGGEVAGIASAGELYTPKAGAVVRGGVLQVGTTKFTRILKQEFEGPTLMLTVEYEVSNPPAWVANLQKKHPELGITLKGVRTFTALSSDNWESNFSFSMR